jgi:restriction system protein
MLIAIFVGLLVTVAAAAVVVFFIKTQRKTTHTRNAGIATIANMRWRESANLLISALKSRGYSLPSGSLGAADTGGDFEMMHNGTRALVSYKHGTAYVLTEGNVREFSNSLLVNGISQGVLATLGQIEASAKRAADSYNIELINGSQLWELVNPQLNESTLHRLGVEAEEKTRKERSMGVGAACLLGILTAVAVNSMMPESLPEAPEASLAETGSFPAAANSSTTNAPSKTSSPVLDDTANKLAEIAKLTDEEKVVRRAQAAQEVRRLGAVRTAAWSASTLVVSLNSSDGRDERAISQICQTILKREELRYTRVQLDPPPGSDLRVRWTQCQ